MHIEMQVELHLVVVMEHLLLQRMLFGVMQLMAMATLISSLWYLNWSKVQPADLNSSAHAELQLKGGDEEACTSFSTCELLKRPIWEVPPDGSKLPSVEAFFLDRSMVEFRARNNVILATFGNFAFMDFVATWVKGLTRIGVVNLLVGAMDDQSLEYLFWKGIPAFRMKIRVGSNDTGWGSPGFHQLGREKVHLIHQVTSYGFHLVLCDSDMVWLKNPLPFFERYPDAHVLLSTDSLTSTVEEDSLEKWYSAYHGALNIGVVLYRASTSTELLLHEWQKKLSEDANLWDQAVFNELLQRAKLAPVDSNSSDLFHAYDGSLKVGVLPISIFCSGHTYFIQALYKRYELEPYAVHATYTQSGTAGKRHRFREAMLFEDEADYYDSPGGYISFDSSLPSYLFSEKGNRTVEAHFALVNYQLIQIRNALAFALILNRTLVMPPIWCRNDRIYYGHPGVIPGTKVEEYFICPLDHVLEVGRMLEDLNEDEFGPKIQFREYSFLQNPRLQKRVNNSRLRVQVCEPNTSGCDGRKAGEVVKLPKHVTDEQVEAALSRHGEVKVLEFSSMKDAFGGFSNEVRGQMFKKRVERFAGIWCCVEKKAVGHINYDLYWDTKPDWKPIPPQH